MAAYSDAAAVCPQLLSAEDKSQVMTFNSCVKLYFNLCVVPFNRLVFLLLAKEVIPQNLLGRGVLLPSDFFHLVDDKTIENTTMFLTAFSSYI